MSNTELMVAACIGVGLAVTMYIIHLVIEANTESKLKRFREDFEAIGKQNTK